MHSFAKQAPLRDKLLKGNTLKEYVKTARIIAEDKKAIKVYEVGNYKDFLNVPGSWSAHYFGASIEFLCETYFEVFGAKYNLGDIKSADDFKDAEEDTGVDHYAQSLSHKALSGSQNYRRAEPMSPVFIQTKGTLDPRKEFTTNDGARLPNFFMNAQAQALERGCAYTARYILFTTGKGIHWKLENNSGGLAEIVNFREISKHVDNNTLFWNAMRKKAKVRAQKVVTSVDTGAELNAFENDRAP
jgi:hypothetical protein